MDYRYVLYLLGYGWNIKRIDTDDNYKRNDIGITPVNITIDIVKDPEYSAVKTSDVTVETVGTVETKNSYNIINIKNNYMKQCNGKCLTNALNIIYNIFIITVLSWSLVYSCILAVQKTSSQYIYDVSFDLLYLVQYIGGIIFFRRKKFYNKVHYSRDSVEIFTRLVTMSVVISFMLAITNVSLLNSDKLINIYTSIYNNNKILWSIVLFTENIFMYLAFFVNVASFYTGMRYHIKKINSCNEKIGNRNTFTFGTVVTTVVNEINTMREEFSESISDLNIIFTSFNIIGVVGIYMTLKNIQDGIYPINNIINMCITIVVEIIYIYSIYQVRYNLDEIRHQMTSIKYISQLMPRIMNRDAESKTDTNHEYEILVATKETNECMKWNIMKDILNAEWDTFNIFGFSITDIAILQKLMGILVSYLIATDVVAIIKGH